MKGAGRERGRQVALGRVLSERELAVWGACSFMEKETGGTASRWNGRGNTGRVKALEINSAVLREEQMW